MASTSYGSVEFSISEGGYGGDFELDPVTSDLLLVIDQPGNPAATLQRLTRLLLTNPRPRDVDQNAIGLPDDLFHPDYGAGLGAAVGENFTPQLVNGMKARILAALANDPYISITPKPIVTISQSGALLTVSLSCYTVLGDPIVITQLPISGGG